MSTARRAILAAVIGAFGMRPATAQTTGQAPTTAARPQRTEADVSSRLM
jgi:hypothetical protein